MALHNGIDTVAVISLGVFSKTYGSADDSNIASLFTSFGLLESAPAAEEIESGFNQITLGIYGIHSSPGLIKLG